MGIKAHQAQSSISISSGSKVDSQDRGIPEVASTLARAGSSVLCTSALSAAMKITPGHWKMTALNRGDLFYLIIMSKDME